jgi:hypothetical protein
LKFTPAKRFFLHWRLVHVLRTTDKPVRDVYRTNDGGYRISFDGWEVDAAAVNEAVAKGWLVPSYGDKFRNWWRLPEHMPASRPRGWPRARRVRGRRKVG